MNDYKAIKMIDFSADQIDQIRILEQLCKNFDRSSLRVGVESLKADGGDHAFLCLNGNQIIGFVSWYTSDEIEANINGMVHPDYRGQGIFRKLMKSVAAELKEQGIGTCRLRVPANSRPGIACIQHLGADFSTSEFTMNLTRSPADTPHPFRLVVRPAEARDFEFLVQCSAQAFGDSESWTRNYFLHTNKPERVTYIAWDGPAPVGIIRVNHLDTATAVIHDFCVLTSCQGRGYGREILTRAVNILLTKRYSSIRLGVVTDNRRALNLYQSVGFEVTAESHYYVTPVANLS
ncbi:GNAT family N-acetyltransferase [Paenibacillus sp. P96]|uniref:GNAT family N-acetyltransferase n=1 Tax=Paenibacillus zeirhizosphaerae TaxID=2987519 RepID=A0ABT9FQX1_9BACL|nr:GNAT family N-acetyltransferase [Paenibacillus sp. P96]MDP4097108.1 GNAT family N-acetyltransferase [Paenibacillus sp. P96]